MSTQLQCFAPMDHCQSLHFELHLLQWHLWCRTHLALGCALLKPHIFVGLPFNAIHSSRVLTCRPQLCPNITEHLGKLVLFFSSTSHTSSLGFSCLPHWASHVFLNSFFALVCLDSTQLWSTLSCSFLTLLPYEGLLLAPPGWPLVGSCFSFEKLYGRQPWHIELSCTYTNTTNVIHFSKVIFIGNRLKIFY